MLALFGKKSHSPGWMITLADLLSLLVSFFALLYSTTATDPARWNKVIKPISAYLTGEPVLPSELKSAPASSDDFSQNYTASILSRLLDSDATLSGGRVTVTDRGIRISFTAHQALDKYLAAGSGLLTGMARILDSLHVPVNVTVYQQERAAGSTPVSFDSALRTATKIASQLKNAGFNGAIHAIGMVESGTEGFSRLELSIPNLDPAADPAGGHSGY